MQSVQSIGGGGSLIVELDVGENVDIQGSCYERDAGEPNVNPEVSEEWAVTSPKDQVNKSEKNRQHLKVEDLEELEADISTENTHPHYFYEKLSDVPAVRDQREIEAADRALEILAHKPPHQLTAADRVWELAARGGSTQDSERLTLDRESKEKVKETLCKNKLTDKTTLAF